MRVLGALAAAALLGAQAQQLEVVVAVSSGPPPPAVKSLLELKSSSEIAESARLAGARAEQYPDLSGVVLVVGDPFGLDARTRNVAVVEEIARIATLGKPLELSALSETSRATLAEWVSIQTAQMFSCEVASMEGGKVGVDIGYATVLTDGTREFRTFVGEDREVLAEKSEIALKKIEPKPGETHRYEPEQISKALVERATVQFTSPLSDRTIAARARLMQAYLADVEARGQALFDRFDAACDSLALQSGTQARVGMQSGSLSPRDQQKISYDLQHHFGQYGFGDADEAASFFSRARVKTASRKLQIGLMLRLPDGTIEGYSSNFP